MIAHKFKEKMDSFEEGNECEELAEWITVCGEIVQVEGWSEKFNHIDKKSLKGLSQYIKKQEHPAHLHQVTFFIEKMFLDDAYAIYASSEDLFESFLIQFPHFDHESKGVLVEILIEMIQENKKLVKIANQPYFFLEFFLHDINQCIFFST